MLRAMSASNPSIATERWILDSGATKHMIGDLNLFTDYKNYFGFITFGNNSVMKATHIGHVAGMSEVIYIPEFKHKLLSVHQLCRQFGVEVCLNSRYGILRKPCGDSFLEIIIAEYDTSSGLYLAVSDFDMSRLVKEHCYAAFTELEPSLTRTEKQELRLNHLWKVAHETYGHVSINRLREIRNKAPAKCFIPASPPTRFFCEVCARAKAHRTPKTRRDEEDAVQTPELDPLSKICSDVAGPFSSSYGEFRYYCLFVDKATRYRWVYFLKKKSEVFERFQQFSTNLKQEFGRTLGTFKTDGGGEYTSTAFEAYLERHGITHELSAPYSQWQNGIAERSNRTIKEMARAMLIASNTPVVFLASCSGDGGVSVEPSTNV